MGTVAQEGQMEDCPQGRRMGNGEPMWGILSMVPRSWD